MSEDTTVYTGKHDADCICHLCLESKKDADRFEEIILAQIDRPDQSIRFSIDPDYVKELANSIREQGLLQPIVVYKKGERYKIIAGDRRYLAVSSLGWPTVMCSIKNVDEQQVEFQRAVENLIRVDMSAIEEGATYKNLRDKYGLNIDQIATKTGKTAVVVKRRIDLLTFPESIQKAIHKGEISTSVGEELQRIKDGNVMEYYLSFAVENGVTKDVARQWVKDWEDRKRQENNAVVPIESLPPAYANKITYYSCDTCQQAVDITKVITLRICGDCAELIRVNMQSE